MYKYTLYSKDIPLINVIYPTFNFCKICNCASAFIITIGDLCFFFFPLIISPKSLLVMMKTLCPWVSSLFFYYYYYCCCCYIALCPNLLFPFIWFAYLFSLVVYFILERLFHFSRPLADASPWIFKHPLLGVHTS